MKFLNVVKWDSAPNVFAFKYPEVLLNTKAQVIVAESQEAILEKEGQFYGPLGPGRHVLDTKNFPFLSDLVSSTVTAGKTPFTADVWFIQKAIPLNIKWGTSDPIQLEDPKYHIMLPVRAFGQYGIQIVNSQKFLGKLVGRLPVFVEKTLTEYFRGIITTCTKSCIGSYLIEQNISILHIASRLNEISEYLQNKITSELDNYGVKTVSFTVNSVSTDENDPAVSRLKEALAKKAEMNIIGYTYQQKRSFDTMETAAGNQGAGGSLMNAGMGLGMGVGIGAPMGNMMGVLGQNLQTAQTVTCSKCGRNIAADSVFCPGCGHSMKTSGKSEENRIECIKCGTESPKGFNFCPKCGSRFHCCPDCGADNAEDAASCRKCGKILPKKCPSCGAMTAGDMKFCGKCGTVLKKVCPKCGKSAGIGMNFCPDCGSKLD